jgi:hypothetical protein
VLERAPEAVAMGSVTKWTELTELGAGKGAGVGRLRERVWRCCFSEKGDQTAARMTSSIGRFVNGRFVNGRFVIGRFVRFVGRGRWWFSTRRGDG